MKTQAPDFENTRKAFAYKHNWELIRDYSVFRLMNFSTLVSVGVKTASAMVDWGVLGPLVLGMKPTVYSIFCGGPSLEKSIPKIELLKRYGVDSVLDYGVEGKESEEDFERTAREIHKAIDFAAEHDATKIVCSKFTGLIPFGILEKLHDELPLSKEESTRYLSCVDRINNICEHAASKDISLFVDAEESWIQKPLDELTFSLMKLYNKEKPIVYNTIQLYLKSRLGYFKSAQQEAEKQGFIYAAKLVRGAYMEKEAARARKKGYKNPVQASKSATDADYNAAVEYALQNIDKVAICVATHNEESCRLAAKSMADRGIDAAHPHVVFSQLLGMSDNLTFNLAEAGYQTAKYMPYGPVRDVIPYLVRRAQENTSVAGQMGRELQLLTTEMKRRKLPAL
jgi:proline dehydrogenase